MIKFVAFGEITTNLTSNLTKLTNIYQKPHTHYKTDTI